MIIDAMPKSEERSAPAMHWLVSFGIMSLGVCHFVIVQNNNIITVVFATGTREGFSSATMLHVCFVLGRGGWSWVCHGSWWVVVVGAVWFGGVWCQIVRMYVRVRTNQRSKSR